MLRRLTAGSRAVRLLRQLAAGSRLAVAVRDVLRPTPGAGLRWTAHQEARSVERLRRVVNDSAIVTTTSRASMAAGAAWQDSRFAAWLSLAWGTEVVPRVRVGGVAIVAAVLTHSAWFAVFGIDVSSFGWSLRAALIAGGVAAAWRPEAVADAVNDKAGRAD